MILGRLLEFTVLGSIPIKNFQFGPTNGLDQKPSRKIKLLSGPILHSLKSATYCNYKKTYTINLAIIVIKGYRIYKFNSTKKKKEEVGLLEGASFMSSPGNRSQVKLAKKKKKFKFIVMTWSNNKISENLKSFFCKNI